MTLILEYNSPENEVENRTDEQTMEEKRNSARYECKNCGLVVEMPKFSRQKKKCAECNGKLSRIVEARFCYDFVEPEKPILTIEQVKEEITKRFPDIWELVEPILCTYTTLSLKQLSGCPALILVGKPAGEKTTALGFFYSVESSYVSDEFTPRAFVTHAANLSPESLEEIDLLPRIVRKALITAELAPLFSLQKDKLTENLGTLTRVLDGEGYNKDSGVYGQRGYSGDYKFVWLGATTPIKNTIWQTMGSMGNRLFFLSVKDKERSNDDYVSMFTGKSYDQKCKECRGIIKSFLDNHFKKYPIRDFEWVSKNEDVLKKIIAYAQFLSKARASFSIWKSSDSSGDYDYNAPLFEEPPRIINFLLNLAKGHALINNREEICEEDLNVVKQVCLSSMPFDRYKLIQLLIKHDGTLSNELIRNELGCSDEKARVVMNSLHILGIVDINHIPFGTEPGRPATVIILKDEWRQLLFA